MSIRVLLVSLVLLLLTFCKSNKSQKNHKAVDCSEFNNKFIDFQMTNEKDSALYYIDKAIACDFEDDFFKMEKIKLLIKYQDYLEASKLAERLSMENDPTYKLLYGVLLLRQNDINANEILQESYELLSSATKSYNDENSNLHYYRIGLDNYFNDKKYSLAKVIEYKNNYTTANDVQIINYIEELINNKSKKELLFSFFNIK